MFILLQVPFLTGFVVLNTLDLLYHEAFIFLKIATIFVTKDHFCKFQLHILIGHLPVVMVSKIPIQHYYSL